MLRRVILLGRKVLSSLAISFTPSTSSGQFEKEVIKHVRSGLTLVGLVAIEDPPRDEILEVVRILRRAGIRIFMVQNNSRNPSVTSAKYVINEAKRCAVACP